MATRPGETILIVDDEPAIRKFLRISLRGHGYSTLEADCGQQALQLAREQQPDAILLDLGLPDLSGLEVTRNLRLLSWVPILFLSVNDEELTKVEALDAGADDYLTKPFGVTELLARLRAALRRKHTQPTQGVLTCGRFQLDQDRREVTIDGLKVAFSPNEFSMLAVLLRNQGKVVSHRQILHEVWGPGYSEETHMLRVNISNLRRKLAPFGEVADYLVNSPGMGYYFEAPLEAGE